MFGTAQAWGGVAFAAALVLAPAASAARPKHARPAIALSEAPTLDAFTPASGDPRVAAAFARSGLGTGTLSGGAFRFTPSGGAANRRAVTVAVRAHIITRADAAKALSIASAQIAPSAYSLGASVGWKRFAISGDMAKVDGGLVIPGRESADVGFSISGKRWAGKVDLAGERGLANQPAFGIDQNWSVGLGGSYALTHNLDLSGGVRYKTERDELFSLTDNRHDSQAVYLGTTFKF
jgi:hypothetical protein